MLTSQFHWQACVAILGAACASAMASASSESNFSAEMESATTLGLVQGVQHQLQQVQQHLDASIGQLQANLQLEQQQQQMLWGMVAQQGQQLETLAAYFQAFTMQATASTAGQPSRAERRKAASAKRPQRREREALRGAVAAATPLLDHSDARASSPSSQTSEVEVGFEERLQATAARASAASAPAQLQPSDGREVLGAADGTATPALGTAEERAIRAEAEARAAREEVARADARAVAAEARARAAEAEAALRVAEMQRVHVASDRGRAWLKDRLARAQEEAAASVWERLASEQRATAAEARAAAAETACAEALAEVQRARSAEAQHLEKSESLLRALRSIREELRCPVLHGLCEDPVVGSDGKTYERQAIMSWLREHGTSPFTRDPMQKRVYPNRFAAYVLEILAEVDMGTSESESSTASQNPQDADDPDPTALRAAIDEWDETTAMSLLRRAELPGLNYYPEGPRGRSSVLHRAIEQELPEVAMAIVRRPDFELINMQEWAVGYTALHQAAHKGYLRLCQAIINREDFYMVLNPGHYSATASQMATNFPEVAAFLQAVENRAREEEARQRQERWTRFEGPEM